MTMFLLFSFLQFVIPILRTIKVVRDDEDAITHNSLRMRDDVMARVDLIGRVISR
jgi:hypothetical protein